MRLRGCQHGGCHVRNGVHRQQQVLRCCNAPQRLPVHALKAPTTQAEFSATCSCILALSPSC